jgi:hypothetical protein
MSAMGIGNIIKDGKIDTEQLKNLKGRAEQLGGGDARLGMKAALLTGDDKVAEGALRLVNSLAEVEKAQEKIINSTGNLKDTYYESLSLGEAFRANINRIKSVFAKPLAFVQEKVTNALGAASQSDVGATAVVAGGGLLAAILAGGGLRGIGSILSKGAKGGMVGGLVGSVAKGAAAEAITGEKTMPVYVVNAAEISAGGAMGGLMGGGAGGVGGKIGGLVSKMGPLALLLGKAGLIAGGAAAVGYGAYKLGDGLLNPGLDKVSTGKTSEGFEGNIIERLMFKLDKLIGGESSTNFMNNQQVQVRIESKIPNIKATPKPSRGGAN